MPRSSRIDTATVLVRVAGTGVIALTLLPLYRILDQPTTGPIGEATVRTTATQTQFLWTGTGGLVCLVALAAFLLPDQRLQRWTREIATPLLRGSDRAFAAGVAMAAAGAVALQNLLVFRGRPNLLDAAAQLIHARYLARGHLAGPGAGVLEGGFWQFPNTLATAEGWVSHFPPGHSLILAPGLALGTPWLGPVVVAGLTGWLTARLAFRLFPHRPLVARGGALLGGLSPLLLLQTSAFMNHGTAALLGVATVLSSLRAREGGWGWAAATGAGVTALLLVRPLGAVAVCLTVVLLVWLPAVGSRRAEVPSDGGAANAGADATGLGPDRLAALCGGAVLGGLPLLLLHGWYNAHFFGHPLTFGYHWSFGEAAGLGFGLDPWGNRFGARESLGYTSADLHTLNLSLVEFPLPVVTLVGLALLLGMGRAWQGRLLAGWALLPVGLSAFYWHHGNFMGPRMLAEFAPAWGLLAAVALAHLVGLLPDRKGRGRDRSAPVPAGWRLPLNPRRAGQLLVVGAAAAALVLVPYRMSGMGGELSAGYRVAQPDAPDGSLVFVTGSWGGRITSELVSLGVPQVVAETALRQNSTCAVEEHRQRFREGLGPLAAYRDRNGWGEGRIAFEASAQPTPGELPPLDLVRRPPPYEGLQVGTVGQETRIRYTAGEELSEACIREIRADERGGVIDAGHLYWLGGLPGIEGDRPIYVRDMGPEANRRILERYPDRGAYVLLRRAAESLPELVPYEEAMALVWDEA